MRWLKELGWALVAILAWVCVFVMLFSLVLLPLSMVAALTMGAPVLAAVSLSVLVLGWAGGSFLITALIIGTAIQKGRALR